MPNTPVRTPTIYDNACHSFSKHGASTEGATHIPFQNLLAEASKRWGLQVGVREQPEVGA